MTHAEAIRIEDYWSLDRSMILLEHRDEGIVVHRSFINRCINPWHNDRMER